VYGPEHDTVGICVEDDGVGMAAENTSDGVGLASIVARARELGGAVEIGRAAMGGMRIEVRLPLPVAGAEVGASA
jgi:signal transduction histidine kinase